MGQYLVQFLSTILYTIGSIIPILHEEIKRRKLKETLPNITHLLSEETENPDH